MRIEMHDPQGQLLMELDCGFPQKDIAHHLRLHHTARGKNCRLAEDQCSNYGALERQNRAEADQRNGTGSLGAQGMKLTKTLREDEKRLGVIRAISEYRYCRECGGIIREDEEGVPGRWCHGMCPYDGRTVRPPNTVIRREYEQTCVAEEVL